MVRKGPGYRLVIFLMGLTALVVTTDFSIVAVALPSIGRDLHVPPSSLSWVISAAALLTLRPAPANPLAGLVPS